MKADELEQIGDTLLALASPRMKPKDLLKAVKEIHPRASKKEIVRAAFYAIIARADDEPEKSRTLQAFAIAERLQV